MSLDRLFSAPVRWGVLVLLLVGPAMAQDTPHALVVIGGEATGPVSVPVHLTAGALKVRTEVPPSRNTATATGCGRNYSRKFRNNFPRIGPQSRRGCSTPEEWMNWVPG